MTFKLKSLTVENFVVFNDRTTIDFSSTLINNIEGIYKSNALQSNGAGKSLLIDAISLALFGKGIRTTYISDYISSNNPSGGIYIGLELVDATGTQLKIERWRRPNSDTNKAKLWKNGVSISQDATVSKIDEMLQSYIGVTHSNFLSCIFSVMIPGFLKLRPSQRFEILEQALAVKKIETVIKKINTAIRLDEEKLVATNTSLLETSAKLASETTKKQIYSVNNKNIIDTITQHTNNLQALLIDEKKKTEELSQYKALLSEANDKLSPVIEKRDALQLDIYSLESSKTTINQKLKTILKAFKTKSGGELECAICKSSLTEDSKDSVKLHYTAELDLVESKLQENKKALTTIVTKADKLIATKTKIESVILTLNKQISYIQMDLLATEKSLKLAKDALNISSSAYSETKLKELKKEYDNLVSVKSTLEKNLKINNAWKQAMSKNGLRLAYIKEEVSTLSALASKYASAVYEKPIQIKFFINDDKEIPTLDFHVNGKNASLFSTGEGRRLEIAMTLSLMSLLKTSGLDLGFLVLDEALDGLSESSKKAVLKVIDSLSSEYQILMISHDPLIKQRPGHIIQVIKDDTTSTSTIKIYQK